MTASITQRQDVVLSAIAVTLCGQIRKDHAHPERDAQSRSKEKFTEGERKMIYKNALDKAVERIKGYCLKLVACDDCRFATASGCMLKQSTPADWELPDKKKEN